MLYIFPDATPPISLAAATAATLSITPCRRFSLPMPRYAADDTLPRQIDFRACRRLRRAAGYTPLAYFAMPAITPLRAMMLRALRCDAITLLLTLDADYCQRLRCYADDTRHAAFIDFATIAYGYKMPFLPRADAGLLFCHIFECNGALALFAAKIL